MTAIIKKVKCSTKSIKDKCMDFYKKHRYVSGITVIELVLIYGHSDRTASHI